MENDVRRNTRKATMLKFNDGVEFDTSGALRIEERFDGLYVVGDGMLVAVKSEEEGEKIIADHNATQRGGKKMIEQEKIKLEQLKELRNYLNSQMKNFDPNDPEAGWKLNNIIDEMNRLRPSAI
jgi:hypothetical protein